MRFHLVARHDRVFLHREVVATLIEEYKACESPNYINWGMGGGADGAGAAVESQGGKEAAAAT